MRNVPFKNPFAPIRLLRILILQLSAATFFNSIGQKQTHAPQPNVLYWITSSVNTLKPASVHGPNEVTIATSVASRPRAIRMRPMRGVLCAGIERVPAAAEIGLEPGAEIHRRIGSAARRCRRDSRCSSAPERSCSGTA